MPFTTTLGSQQAGQGIGQVMSDWMVNYLQGLANTVELGYYT